MTERKRKPAKNTAPTLADAGALDGLRVVEAPGAGLAVHVVGMLLAEQGASVVRLVDPARPAADPVLEAMLARGKTQVWLSGDAGLDRFLAAADVVVGDEGDRHGLPVHGLELAERVAAARRGGNRGLVFCRIPAFPVGDARGRLPAHEAAVSAAGRLFEKPLGGPRYHDFPVASCMAGLFAATGVVAALVPRLRTGVGQDVEVTRFHAALFAQILGVLMKTGVPRGFLPLKMVGTPFMGAWRCQDGRYIYLHITLPAHAARILDMLEANGHGEGVRALRSVLSPETMRDPSQVGSIPEAKRIKAAYERIFLTRPAEAWERLLGGELCCIKVRTADEWVKDSIAAGMTDACALEDPLLGEVMGPGPAVTSNERTQTVRPREVGCTVDEVLSRWAASPRPSGPAGPAGEGPAGPPLAGMRVVDLSRVIAGPCAARVLAELGAEVVSIQNPTGLDWALSFHLMFNAGKRSVTLPMTDEAGKQRLWAIMEKFRPDALVQNYRHMDVARAVGVDPESVRAHFPSIVYTHLNAYGDKGEWKDRPGFEQVVQAVSGIQMTYGTGGRPRLLPTPVIDIGSGLTGAFATVLGLYDKARTGRGVVVQTHLTWVSVLLQVHRIAAAQREGCLAAARTRGAEVAVHSEGRASFTASGLLPSGDREVLAGIGKARDGYVCVTGPRRELATWLRALGASKSAAAEPLEALFGALRWHKVEAWVSSASRAGVARQVAVLEVPRMGTLLAEVGEDQGGKAPVLRRRYPGCDAELTFVRNPLRLSATPLVDVAPPTVRGGSTREVLGWIGVDAPEGEGAIPYPRNKPLLLWALNVVRWGYFAWRSGNF